MNLQEVIEIYGLTNLPECETEFKKIPLDFIEDIQNKYNVFDSKRYAYLTDTAQKITKDSAAYSAFCLLSHLLSIRKEGERIKMTVTPADPLLQTAAFFSILYYLPRAAEFLKSRDIDGEIVMNSTLAPFINSIKETDNGWFFDVTRLYSWSQLYMDAKLLRVGVLNFELRDRVKEDCGGRLSPDDAVINVHIPAGVRLTPENCEYAYGECARIVKKTFPDFKYKAFVCFSWMMDKQLKNMLGPDSNILRFQSRFTTFFRDKPTDGVLTFVFGYPAGVKPDYSELAEDTSLRRAIKAHLLAGGSIYADGGIFFDY